MSESYFFSSRVRKFFNGAHYFLHGMTDINVFYSSISAAMFGVSGFLLGNFYLTRALPPANQAVFAEALSVAEKASSLMTLSTCVAGGAGAAAITSLGISGVSKVVSLLAKKIAGKDNNIPLEDMRRLGKAFLIAAAVSTGVYTGVEIKDYSDIHSIGFDRRKLFGSNEFIHIRPSAAFNSSNVSAPKAISSNNSLSKSCCGREFSMA